MMIRPLVLSLVATVTLLVPYRSAEACSIASDYADPPELELEYDADNAPSSPDIVDAYVSHRYESDAFGGCGTSSCGDIHGLNLAIEGESGASGQLLRITHEDGTAVYARVPEGSGLHQLFLPGYSEVGETIELQIAFIDEAGHPSLDVEWAAQNQEDNDPSCSAAGSDASGLSTALFILLGLMAGRRSLRCACRPL